MDSSSTKLLWNLSHSFTKDKAFQLFASNYKVLMTVHKPLKHLQSTRMTDVENEALLTFFNRLRKNILGNFTDIKFETA